jgi:hypothetical protein
MDTAPEAHILSNACSDLSINFAKFDDASSRRLSASAARVAFFGLRRLVAETNYAIA